MSLNNVLVVPAYTNTFNERLDQDFNSPGAVDFYSSETGQFFSSAEMPQYIISAAASTTDGVVAVTAVTRDFNRLYFLNAHEREPFATADIDGFIHAPPLSIGERIAVKVVKDEGSRVLFFTSAGKEVYRTQDFEDCETPELLRVDGVTLVFEDKQKQVLVPTSKGTLYVIDTSGNLHQTIPSHSSWNTPEFPSFLKENKIVYGRHKEFYIYHNRTLEKKITLPAGIDSFAQSVSDSEIALICEKDNEDFGPWRTIAKVNFSTGTVHSVNARETGLSQTSVKYLYKLLDGTWAAVGHNRTVFLDSMLSAEIASFAPEGESLGPMVQREDGLIIQKSTPHEEGNDKLYAYRIAA